MRATRCLLVLWCVAVPARAQSTVDHMANGRALADAREPAAALREFQAALRQDSTQYEANWRAALAAVDIGKQTPDSVKSRARDSLYGLAETYARRAVAANVMGPDGHFMLANAVGRASLTKSKKERVRRAKEIRIEALKTLELDPKFDGAYNVLGQWNAEIMRLSGMERFFAKNFLGGDVFSKASWKDAIANMKKAVELRPDFLYHRLELARIYIDQKHYAEAREQLEIIPSLPIIDVMDPVWKQDAARLLRSIHGK
jgi:tetratricopeptide (TPR) repeat protein